MNMTKSKYAGMTVNERLCIAGLMGDFEIAAKERNRIKLIEILQATDLTEEQAIGTTDALLANPKFYGY